MDRITIELRGQVFAIPMAEVSAIQRMTPARMESEGATGLLAMPGDTVKTIDLGQLLQGRGGGEPARHRYVVLVSPPAGTCGVVVDGVRDVVVVRANGMTLVTTRRRAAHLKTLLEMLPDEFRNLTS